MTRPLPQLACPRRLLSFDFDGTLHHPADDPPIPSECFEWIRHLREERSAIWCINTGRSFEHLIEGMAESRFPFLPDWIVAREREIYQVDPSGKIVPHAEWNDRCETEMHAMFDRAYEFLQRVRREVGEHTGADWIEMEGEPAGVISRTDEEMDWICKRVVELGPPADLGWQRNSIYLRFGHKQYHKGSSLGEIARLNRLASVDCFAIGDGHNDLEMLDGEYAAYVACPANAVPEVREKVAAQRGYIATQAHGRGAFEALQAYASAQG